MRPQVLLQQHFPREPLAALGALVRLNPRMYPDMHIERHALVEALRAMRTLVLFLVPVDLQMAAQVSLIVEGFVALRTFGRELFGSTMHRQVVLVVAQL
jgi:hypothetical protein